MKKFPCFYLSILFVILSISLSKCKRDDNKSDYSYLEKYIGNWEFKVYIIDGRSDIDTSYTLSYNGVINLYAENKITICYKEGECTTKSVDKGGKILNAAPSDSIGQFDGTNRAHLLLITGTLGTGYYIEDISGQKLDGEPIIDLSPITTTKAAIGITLKGALLNGTVLGNCLYTNVYFEFGSSSDYGKTFDAYYSYHLSSTPINPFCVTHTISYYVSGLTSGTLYHYRAKAVNSNGATYGSDMTFTTSTPTNPETDIDGNVYSTVPIGNQIWMAENLKATHFNDGTAIPTVPDNEAWVNLTTPGYCWYNNDSVTYKANYGALYNWYTVSTGKLCPNGWHVPNNDEWIILSNSLGGWYLVGTKLQATGIANWSGSSPETNVTGFTALPGGYRYFDSYTGMGTWTSWWSTTEYVSSIGSSVYCFDIDLFNGGNAFKEFGLSVRCLKDQ